MVKDCLEYAKRCKACHFHANFIHQPPEPLHPTITSWPFDAWGLNVVGPISPKFSCGHAYILAVTYYFSKWAKAVLFKEVKKEIVVEFIRSNMIFRHGVPRHIITNNGRPFYNKLMDKLQIHSLQIAIQEGLTVKDNVHLRLEELEALDEKRLEAK
ncbi:hypothetical protein CDL12_18752 [Handroanthus impetiginosus]|uniref:Integrase catalytic domain-containing protein n=1 Tax=Handroanthus impetiginosus TaxID=429701 RepID=A0A2G9GTS8_9LAMI|nr:hypothetical protein CDL12_18752 [Handroanthus impetiginosus]